MESKVWKIVTVTSYLGLHIGVLLITATLPFALIILGERNGADLPIHRDSFNTISHWLIGMGGITFFVSFLTLLASFVNVKPFRVVATVLLVINTLLAVGLLIWGLVPTESRRIFLRDSWMEMKLETKALIQNYYSCCGFEALPQNVDDSCYTSNSTIVWPDGCYKRVTSAILEDATITNSTGHQTVEKPNKFNAFLAAFLFPVLLIILNQLISSVLCITGLAMNPVKYAMKNGNGLTIENKKVSTTSFSSENVAGSLSTVSQHANDNNDLSTHQGNATEELKADKTRCSSIADLISQSLENAFYWIGVKVAENPKTTIITTLLLAASFSVGFLQRDSQVPGGSGFLPEYDPIIEQYIARNLAFPNFGRNYYLLVVDKNNILQEKNWKAMLDLDHSVKTIKSDSGFQFEDLCLKVDPYCVQHSLFEFWNFNSTLIRNLTIADVRSKISKNPLTSPVYKNEVEISTILGSIVRDNNGTIQTARAHLMEYVIGVEEYSWERKFLDLRKEDHGDIEIYAYGQGSGNFEATRGYQEDLYLLFIGFFLIFLYILVMTGKFSLLEHRIYIALTGVISSGLGMVVGISLASSLGFDWSAVHLVMTFLVLGIGVDDMFILIQSWNNIEDNPEHKNKSITEKSGLVLKTAGVSITVTSITDLVAFGVGASSDIVTFASFSIYVSLCIISLFVIQCTFFFACTVLDQRRRDARYDACLFCCYKHNESYKRGKFADLELVQTFFEDVLGRLLQFLPIKIIVIVITLAITGFMGWGFYNLKVDFNGDWYFDADSYIHEYKNSYKEHFRPGIDSNVFVINADFYSEREKLHLLYEKLSNNTNLNQKYLSSWYEDYAAWLAAARNISDVNVENAFVSPVHFYVTVAEYLQTEGRNYANDVSFHPSGVVVASSFKIRHNAVQEPVDNIPIVDSIRQDCESVGFSNYCFPLTKFYFDYSIIKIIQREVYRNLGITLLCVFVVVLPMIASIQISFWVLVCVLFTLVNVAGSMYFAGFSIEGGTVVTLLLAVGLAVDYAAHIAHTFLILRGSRNMRMRVTVGQIGPAVFNGGFSTFIAVVALSGSEEYTYKVFFTVLSCVVVYGLWNGLIFLPSVLGLVGPSPHSAAVEAKLSERHYRRKIASDNVEQN